MQRTAPRILITALFLLCAGASTTRAQCTIAAYADAAGTSSLLSQYVAGGQTFSIYVVMFTEDTAAAAAYRFVPDLPELGQTIFLQDRIFGPSGNGLVIDESTGTNVALTECVYGFSGAPILVTEYEYVVAVDQYPEGIVSLEANTSQGETPVYVTCTNIIKPCDPGPTLSLFAPFPAQTTSFGAVKSLFGGE